MSELRIHIDIVHPASGEVLAKNNDILDAQTAHAQHVLSVAESYPTCYFIYYDNDNHAVAISDGPTVL